MAISTNNSNDDPTSESYTSYRYPVEISSDQLASETAIKNQVITVSKPTNPKDSIGIRKAPMSTIPSGVIAELGVAMLEGAAKYGRHNYREAGVRASVYYDALQRHIIAWWEGEDIDPDSGMNHVTKAIATLAVLRDSMMQENWVDDRPPKSVNFYENLNKVSGLILDRHADKSPKHVTELNKEIK